MAGRDLVLNAALPPESRRFQIAHRLAAVALAGPVAAIVAGSGLESVEARRLLAIGLANYAAGAILMPYDRFRAEARRMRHDIDQFSRAFCVRFEQAWHRLSTMQRHGAEGVALPFSLVAICGVHLRMVYAYI